MKKFKQVSEIYLIAALLSYGYPQNDVDRTNPRRQVYTFEDEEQSVFLLVDGKIEERKIDLDRFESLFLANKVMLRPNYPSVLKSLKYSIYSYRDDKR